MAALERQNGTRVTKAGVTKTTSTISMVRLDEDLYERTPYREGYDKNPAGDRRTLAFKAGTKMTERDYNKLFPAATIDTVSPATGSTAGGTVVTIKGTNLDGATSVTFGGTAGTAFSVVSAKELRVTTPAKTAGAVNVVVVDDSGNSDPKVNAFTFA